MKKLLKVLLLISSILFLSMGGAEHTETSEEGETPPTKVYIAYNRFLTQAFGPGISPIEKIQQELATQYPGIEVELNILPDDIKGMRNAIAIWMNGRDGTVDIYGMDTPWVTEFGLAEWALPLNEYLDLDENFISAGLETFSYENKILGVPFWGSVSGLYYREDLLEEAGYSGPPQSYTEMLEMIKAVRANHPELQGFTWPGGKAESLVMLFADFLYGFGGSYLDENGDYNFDSSAGREALQFMKDLIEEEWSPANVTVWNQQETSHSFSEGQAIFSWNNNDLVLWLDNPERSKIVGNWGFAPSPAQPNGRSAAITGGFAFAVNPYSDEMEASLKVMEVIAGREVQKNFALAWGPIQYYKGLYTDAEVLAANQNANRINQVLPYALNRPPAVRYSQLSSVLQEEIHSALTAQKSVETALQDISRRLEGLR